MIAASSRDPLLALDLSPVSTIAIGGFVNHRKPIALMKLLADHCPRLAPKTLVSLSASIDLDLALDLWPSITTVHCPFQGVEGVSTITPLLEHRLRFKQLVAPPWDTGLLSLALRTPPDQEATSRAGVGTDLPALNLMLREHEGSIRIQGLSIDLALLHAPNVTPVGDVWYDDSPWGDGIWLRNADRVLATFGAIAAAPSHALVYPAAPNWIMLKLPDPTTPTADPPRCEADFAELRQLVTDRKQHLI